jgi:hypothetical protein
MLNHLNLVSDVSTIKSGNLLVIQRKKDNRKIIVKCAYILNRGTGKEEIILSKKNNDYFIWDMYIKGKSWVFKVWNLGDVEITNITNNMNEFPR